MKCHSCVKLLDQFLDGELAEASARDFEAHVNACSDCQIALERKRSLREALRQMPVTPAVHGFYDRALELTVKTTHRSEMKFWASAGLGTAIAASIIAWLVLILPANQTEETDAAHLAGVTISLNVEKTVRVSFESVTKLENVTLRVQLPPGVEISGYQDRREIAWSTDVTPGINILSLPVIVRSGKGGTIVARLEHSGKSKSFKFDVIVS